MDVIFYLFLSPDGYTLIWMKGKKQVAVGNKILLRPQDPRVQLQRAENGNGNTLVVSLAEEADAGEYSCRISTANRPVELRHHVRIRGERITTTTVYY